jgi:PelA/Pel-15E family pectate lyase
MTMRRTSSAPLLVGLALAMLAATAVAQTTRPRSLSVSRLAWESDEWIRSPEALAIADVVITHQRPGGGWGKGYDLTRPRPATAPAERGWSGSTFDNGSTYSELRLLARVHAAHGQPRHREAFERGLRFVFESQYPVGGWPQRFPLEENYGHHITYNDGAVVGVMRVLEAIVKRQPGFDWLDDATRERARESFDRGIACILQTQIRVDGQPVGWAQQYDAKTLAPASARTFEPVCIASSESASLAMLLMSIDEPSPEVKQAIAGVVAWYETTKITGQRYEEVSGPQYENGRDRIIVDDPSATSPIWARMYEIGTNRPIFSGRDGVVKYTLAEVEHERRNGYAWYGRWGNRVLEMHREWKQKHGG